MNGSRLSRQILVGLLLGIAAGWAINRFAASPGLAAQVAGYIELIGVVFIRLIKMIISPLVLATLVTGIAHMRGGAAVGRIFGRTIAWFVVASLVSLSLGLAMVNLTSPGVGVDLPVAPADASADLPKGDFGLHSFIEHVVPSSIARAMADNEVLQIVVFALFAGAALIAIGEKARPIVDFLDAVVHLMLKITAYVMIVAPYAVFAAIAAVIAVHGLQIMGTFARFVGAFYLALALLWMLLIGIALAVLGAQSVRRLAREIREPFLLSFATASSEASYPQLLEGLGRSGLRPQVVSFVLPLGYSFNLDGSMMYCAFASIFIAQAHGLQLSAAQQIGMLLLLMVTSKGIAGVPRASLVVIAATLPYFNIPASGLLIILAVDHFLDMGRTATNVIGNAVAAAVIDRWEGSQASTADLALPAQVQPGRSS
jgi:Na+/H+-dicarboxylate symporter